MGWPDIHPAFIAMGACVLALVAAAVYAARRRTPSPVITHGPTSLSGAPAALPSRDLTASPAGSKALSLDELATHLPARYTKARRVGAGGMGVVFQVEDTLLSRAVAIKMVTPALREDPAACQRFVREARALAALSHPGVLTVYDVQPEPWPFISMELLEGEDLETRLARGPFDDAEFYRIALALLAALEHVHRAGFIHRDLKPANIFVRTDGTALIMDFGLAREPEPTMPTRALAGTPLYMAPEQLEGGPIDTRTDLYAMGLVFHRMLAGALPFDTNDPNARFRGAIVTEVSLGPRRAALAAVLAKTLALDPSARPHTARDVATDLRAARAAAKSPSA